MSFLSRLNPVPSFPEYSGPYKVGTVDAELPVHDLESPGPAPSNPDLPGTVSFRIFYPCKQPESSETPKPVRWLPSPQRGYMSAYAQFLGANSYLADTIGFLPQLIDYTTIPVLRNAPLLAPPTKSERWPVMMFSHGLGGSRNAYSYIVGNLASHGIVVIAPDHRDESSPISYVRATEKTPAKTLGYKRYSHNPSPEVYEGRDEQLKVRLWEMGLIHDAVVRIDKGEKLNNLDPNSTGGRWKSNINEVLSQFRQKLNVHTPGSIIWAGHSFGACTTVQLVKSAYYRVDAEKAAANKYTPLFSPASTSTLVKQITPKSTVILLDIWCLPLRSPATRYLWNKSMPQYAAGGAGGKGILSIFSEAFYKWTGNVNDMKRALAPPTASTREHTQPHLFYPATSAHLSQSDFGILFPWLLKRVLKVEEPDRIVKLNVRATLQVMRENGHEVAETSALDREVAEESSLERTSSNVERKDSATDVTEVVSNDSLEKSKGADWRILDTTKDAIRGWIAFDTVVSNGEKAELEKHESNAEDVEEDSKPPADLIVDEEGIAQSMEV